MELIGSPGCIHSASVDDRKRVGRAAALEAERSILGGVDVNHLTRIQGDSKTRSRVATFVITVPHHDVHAAMAAI